MWKKEFQDIFSSTNKPSRSSPLIKATKPNIKPCKRKDILKSISFELAKDASMNLNLLKKLKAKL